MPEPVFDAQARHDFDRIADHLRQHEAEDVPGRIESIVSALDILKHSPDIGRPALHGSRELVIGRGSRGYVALYRNVLQDDIVIVLALRAQRESGYPRFN